MPYPVASVRNKNFGSSFSPLSLSPIVWLKADTINLSDGADISLWADQSGNGRDYSQGDNSKQPNYILNQKNGLPIVRFNGSSDLLTASGLSSVALSVYYVVKSNTTTSKYLSTFGSNNKGVIQGFTVGKWEWYDTPRTVIGDISTSSFQIISTIVGSSSAGSWGLGATSGGSSWLACDVGEFIAFASALSTGNDSLVKSYLGGKWGLP